MVSGLVTFYVVTFQGLQGPGILRFARGTTDRQTDRLISHGGRQTSRQIDGQRGGGGAKECRQGGGKLVAQGHAGSALKTQYNVGSMIYDAIQCG